ncbi:MAG: chemotaxis protein CheW [Oscillospiraceae bacterium]|nr:chemotaxis protein CheW [Oscillospiraceae bacterium]
MNKNYTPDAEERSELPWLIFTLDEKAYAVNSRFVNGIEMKPGNITPIPDSPDIYCGLVERRGEVYPLLNMRKVFYFPSVDDETEKFVNMIEQRKNDHIRWIETFERCYNTKEKFNLAVDPHKCAFGIWYDQFSKGTHSITFHIKKIEEPHKLLHETAALIINAMNKGEEKKAEILFKKLKNEYYPRVIAVLDEVKSVYRSTYRETVVVLADEEQKLGLLVDEVLAVDKVEPVVGGGTMNLLLQSRFFENVVRNDKIDKEILVVDEEELLKLSEVNA